MLKLVLYSLLLMTNTFALTNEEFFKTIDLEKIEKFTPDNKEVLKYGGDHKGFVDEDGDLADDRLEVFFKKNKTHEIIKNHFHRELYLYRMIKEVCTKDLSSEKCKVLMGTELISLDGCHKEKSKMKYDNATDLFITIMITGDTYSHGFKMGTELSKWTSKNKDKILNTFYDCEDYIN